MEENNNPNLIKEADNKPLISIALALAVLDLILLAFVFSGVLKLQKDIAEIQSGREVAVGKKGEERKAEAPQSS